MPSRTDYNHIGRRYDDEPVRQRPADPELVKYLDGLAPADLADIAALDIGCGTGIQLVENRRRFAAPRMVGLDRHEAMLDAARKKATDIEWVHGDATNLPFSDAEFDYVSTQFCFHHVADKPAMLKEAFRVLRPGGRFVMLNMDPWQMRDWDIYRFFPEAWDHDEHDFLPLEELRGLLAAVGFSEDGSETLRFENESSLAERFDFFQERYSPSQLLAIGDDAFERGLERVAALLNEAGGRQRRWVSRVCIVRLVLGKRSHDITPHAKAGNRSPACV